MRPIPHRIFHAPSRSAVRNLVDTWTTGPTALSTVPTTQRALPAGEYVADAVAAAAQHGGELGRDADNLQQQGVICGSSFTNGLGLFVPYVSKSRSCKCIV